MLLLLGLALLPLGTVAVLASVNAARTSRIDDQGDVQSGFAFSGYDIFMIALPLLLWLLGVVVGWLIIDRLLLRPLKKMQQAISAYRPGETNSCRPPPTARPLRFPTSAMRSYR
jgi:hypothetical protein